jgi:hypothetical protein
VAASRRLRILSIPLPALLIAAAGWWRSGSEAQQADPSVGVSIHGFSDSRSVTVLSPTVDLDKDFTDRTGLRVRFGVDAISAASDSCIRCHPQGADNARAFVTGSLIRKYGGTSVSYGGEFSRENFYTATTGMVSVTRSLNGANTTIAGGYSFSLNQPELHPTDDVETQYGQNAYVSITQTLARRTIAQFGYEIGAINGYQANPFLRAEVDGVRTVGVTPDTRLRHAFTARLRQALPARTFLEADYRRYSDDWDVRGNTFGLGLSHYVTPQVLVSGTYRRYGQTGAYFYAPSYTGSPEYFTADFRLFPFDSNLYTGTVVFTPAQGLFGLARGTGLTLQYEFYDATTGFEAATFTTGVRIPLKRP